MHKLYAGDCREVLPTLDLVDSVVTDPPYGLSFMGKGWDRGVPGVEFWTAIIDRMKPGAHLLAFGGTRTFHRLTCAIEDAGFDIRDCIMWVYGSGFPKSHNVSKAIDKATDGRLSVAAKQWDGWGTALKPAWEPITVARKPLIGTVAANVLEHGTGAINVDGCRVEGSKPDTTRGAGGQAGRLSPIGAQGRIVDDGKGRFPANLIHDGSDEVLELFPQSTSGSRKAGDYAREDVSSWGMKGAGELKASSGSAARFFYCAKTSRRDRGEGNDHPTVKPTDLMRYLCRLVTPPGGTVLDPFMGSGSTGKAAVLEGMRFVGIELDQHHVDTAERRIDDR